MTNEKLSEILNLLTGIKLYEWKSIENAVNREFAESSNRLALTDVSKIQKFVAGEIIRCQPDSWTDGYGMSCPCKTHLHGHICTYPVSAPGSK